MHKYRATGFTLIELILVIVIISAGLVGVVRMFGNANLALTGSEEVQKSAQYAQECAEHVLAVRRDFGFDSPNINSTMCDAPSLPALDAGYSRPVDVPSAYVGPAAITCPNGIHCACPEGINCRDITITVTKGSMSSVVTLMLVQ